MLKIMENPIKWMIWVVKKPYLTNITKLPVFFLHPRFVETLGLIDRG